ncbi:MAG: peptide deformylase [Sphingobacteriia bacterium]|nr:peptide deformylase [Sphingobacteriia bacterium]
MTILPLIIAPDPIYSKKSTDILVIDEEIRKLASDMIDTVYFQHGIGMAATQIGVLKRIIVVDINYNKNDPTTRNPIIMINPEILEFSTETYEFTEGSISFPEAYVKTSRPRKIKVKYTDLEKREHIIQAEDLFSVCIQHEIDYTLGKTYLDLASPLKKRIILEKLLKRKVK